jgi:chromosome segregation ATPase
MEHWAGVMAWEVRRLENVVKIAEDKAARAAQDAREMERLKAIARRTDQLETELDELGQQLDRRDKKLTEQEDEAKILKSELNNRDQRIYDLESAIATTKDELKQRRQHAALIETEVAQHRSRASEMEEMLKNAESQQTGKLQEMERDVKLAEEEKGRCVDERVRLRELAEEGKMQSNMWETAKIGASQALGVQQIGNVAEMVDAIKKLSGSIKTRDEELKILKDEMREVSLGFEDEVARIAKERDSVRSKLEEMSGRSMNDETVRLRQTEGLEAKLRVSPLPYVTPRSRAIAKKPILGSNRQGSYLGKRELESKACSVGS